MSRSETGVSPITQGLARHPRTLDLMPGWEKPLENQGKEGVTVAFGVCCLSLETGAETK